MSVSSVKRTSFSTLSLARSVVSRSGRICCVSPAARGEVWAPTLEAVEQDDVAQSHLAAR